MIVTTVCKLLLALAVGFYLNKKDILTESANRGISTLVMNIALPLVALTSISKMQGADKGEILKFMLTGCSLTVLYPLLAAVLVRLLRVKTEDRGVYECSFVFANVLFMGYPVCAALYGDNCVFYICIFYILFNLMYFTYGVHKLLKGTHARAGKNSFRSFFSNGTIASLISLVLFLANVQIPTPVTEVLDFVGDIAVPVSMIIIGSSIADYPLKNLFADKRIFPVTAIRLVGIPLLIYGLMTVLGFHGELRGIATITAGMPAASMIAMTCTQYGVHESRGSSVVVFTTLCSLITMPFLLTLMKQFA